MKIIQLFFFCLLIVYETTGQGITKNGQITNTSSSFVNKYGKVYNQPVLNKSGQIIVILPTVTSTAITVIKTTNATSGGNITDDGGGTILARGVCYSTTTTPTITDLKTNDGITTGSFISDLSCLTKNTKYYARAYATNSAGTSYGNEVSFTTLPTLTIGDCYLGGKIAYFLQAGDPGYDADVLHGIIAAPTDLNPVVWYGNQWGCSGTVVSGADGTALGTGNQNTIDIMTAGCASGTTYAPYVCSNLVLNGYSDWFLPSKDELYKLYLNRTAIGGFNNGFYWSSSESQNTSQFYANALRFDIGFNNSITKTTTCGVRPIRMF